MVLEIVNRSEILTESSAMSREGCLPGDVGKVQKRLVPQTRLVPGACSTKKFDSSRITKSASTYGIENKNK